MNTISKTRKFHTVAFAAAAFAASFLATSPSSAHSPLLVGWLNNACMASGGNPGQCPCYVEIMLSNSTPYDQYEMLQGRVTPHMNVLHQQALAQCGMQ